MIMKDSGVEWLGDIPAYWKICRLKNVSKIVTGNTPDKKFENQDNYSEQGLMWIKPNDLNGLNYIENTKEYLSKRGELLARIVPANTPLVCCIGSIGKIGVSNEIAAFNQQINGVIFDPQFFNFRYGLYVLISQEPQHWFYANGNVLQILNAFNQGLIKIPLPPLEEQKKISAYLDKKCAAIDSAVDAAKKLVVKFGEYKKALITETVTKGLNRAAKMKESGVEWLGDIPAHWKMGKIKYNYFLKGRIGWQGLKASEFTEEGAFLVTGTDFFNGKVDWSKCYHITEERFDEAPEIHLKSGDLLVTKDGTVGKVAYIDTIPGKASLNSHILLMRPLNTNYSNKFLYFVIKSTYFEIYTNYAQNGAIMASLSQEKIKNFRFPLPPLEEQKEISAYLDKKCAAIDENIEKHRQLAEKLTEYKKSLIYEVVTGKMEV